MRKPPETSNEGKAGATTGEAAGAARGGPWRALVQLLLAALVIAAAIAGWRYMKATAVKHAPRAAREAVEPVRVMSARLTEARPTWTLYGRAVATERVTLRFPLAGRVVEKAAGLDAGTRVSKGQVLARIDDLNYRAALKEAEAALAEGRARLKETEARLAQEKAAVENARAQLAIAERELARAVRLHKKGALPAAQVDKRRLSATQSRLALSTREANLKATAARLEQMRANVTRLEWAVKRARRNLADTTLRAPFGGVVAQAAFEKGQQVSPSEPLVTLVSGAPPEIRLALSERQFGALRQAGEKLAGRRLDVLWSTTAGMVKLAAEVTRVAPEVSEGKGVVHVYARLLDGDRARGLRPGSFVEVKMPGPLLAGVALLPEQAVYDAARVYVVSGGRLETRAVRLRGFSGEKAVVSGLKGGEMVVINRLAGEHAGKKARVLNKVSP